MNRRVLISTAVMEDPRLVIADEPTPGLDKKTAKRAMEHFRNLADMGAAVLVITHDLELALETVDRIAVFYGEPLLRRPGQKTSREKRTFGTPIRKPYGGLCPGMDFNILKEASLM